MSIPNIVGRYQVGTFSSNWDADDVDEPFRLPAEITTQTAIADPEREAVTGWYLYPENTMVGFVHSDAVVRLCVVTEDPAVPSTLLVLIEGKFLEDAPVEYRNRGPQRELGYQQIRGTWAEISFRSGPSVPSVDQSKNVILRKRALPHGVITAPARRVR